MKYLEKSSRKYKLVIDANVIISAVFGGYPEKVIQISISHEIFAPHILKRELEKFVEKVESSKEFPRLKEFFNYILNHIKLVIIDRAEKISRDRSDDFYIAAAINEKVDFLITGDKDLLSCKGIRKWPFKILSPKKFIELIRKS